MSSDADIPGGFTDEELDALADSMLVPSGQARLSDLLRRNAGGRTAPDEEAELDRLLGRIDQLTLLKTRAKYTLWDGRHSRM